ncbi:MAG: response regulator transcription factor [Clostridiales bacterium]|nr:response regulator transcription factor [Clostridiales bacterium]
MFHILVVDDDKNIRYVMKEVLKTAQYEVFTAKNGEEAFNILEREHIDLVIVDIMMPKMDGYEFTKELRVFDSELPVLMVSAKQLPEDRKKGFVVGIDDYMSKPIDAEELLLHVKALLRRSKIINERKITVGSVTLDYDSYTVERNGEVHELPQKEFLLLYKLLSFPNKIFTRIQLMDEIWGVECETGSETVTVHVGRLRKRFEHWDDFEIEAIRGLGYKAVKKK